MEPNQSFAMATVLPAGTLMVSDTLTPGTVFNPDTFLGIRNGFGTITQTNDNGSTLGNGFASGIQGAATNGSTLWFSVTGAGDTNFTGAHSKFGDYEVTVTVMNASGASIGFFDETRTMQPGVVDDFNFSGTPSWIGGFYNVNIENRVSLPKNGDVDFYRFTGLKPGVAFTAQSFDPTGNADLLLYRYSSEGAVLRAANNTGEGPFLVDQIDEVVPANGELIFAVTGHGDLKDGMPVGQHTTSGSYQLRVFQPGLSADFNNNGVVNADDLAIWKAAYKQTLLGDADHDFDTDGADFLLWQRQLGSTAAVGAINAIPEPGGAVLLTIAGGLLGARRRRFGRCSN